MYIVKSRLSRRVGGNIIVEARSDHCEGGQNISGTWEVIFRHPQLEAICPKASESLLFHLNNKYNRSTTQHCEHPTLLALGGRYIFQCFSQPSKSRRHHIQVKGRTDQRQMTQSLQRVPQLLLTLCNLLRKHIQMIAILLRVLVAGNGLLPCTQNLLCAYDGGYPVAKVIMHSR